jgi:hypothetical protein
VKHDFKDWLLACIANHIISHRGMANMSGVPVFHLRGRNPCGAVAFYYSGAIRDGKIIEARHATDPDGRKPKAGEPMRCGGCGETISVTDLLVQASVENHYVDLGAAALWSNGCSTWF